MKKHLLIGSLFFAGLSFSQITVTESSLMQPSDVFEQAYDQSNSITHLAAGTNLSWNYSALVEDSTGQFSIGVASWADGSAEFPNANLFGDDNSGDGSIFFRQNSSSLDFLGLYGDPLGLGANQALQFSPQARITPLPLTYNTTDQNTYTFEFSFEPGQPGVDSIRVKQVVDQDFLSDAWGELTTPLGTFDVVRLMTTEITTDSTWAYSFGTETLFDSGKDTTYTYSFYTDDANVRFTLVDYNYDPASGQIVGDITWLTALPTVSVKEVELSSFSVYPNPVKNELTISSDNVDADYSLIDITGKEILKGEMLKKSSTTVNLSSLKRGVYFVKFFNNENYIGTKKVIKQ